MMPKSQRKQKSIYYIAFQRVYEAPGYQLSLLPESVEPNLYVINFKLSHLFSDDPHTLLRLLRNYINARKVADKS